MKINFILLSVEILLYVLFTLFYNHFLCRERHYPLSKDIDNLTKKMMKEYFSNDFMSWAHSILSREKNLLCRGYLRKLLIIGNNFRGEFDIALRNNVYDEKLFRKDRYYELIFLHYNVCCNYALPGRAEFAEEDYRRFWALYDSGLIDREDALSLSLALCTEIEHAAFHGEWQKVYDYTDIGMLTYDDLLKASEAGVKIEYASLMMIRAEALYHLGRSEEATALLLEWAEQLKPFPYQYGKAQRLLQTVSQSENA
ncbi:MAG: hypothetical protein ACI4XF_08985 [Oscillospiraceae bacterium]